MQLDIGPSIPLWRSGLRSRLEECRAIKMEYRIDTTWVLWESIRRSISILHDSGIYTNLHDSVLYAKVRFLDAD